MKRPDPDTLRGIRAALKAALDTGTAEASESIDAQLKRLGKK